MTTWAIAFLIGLAVTLWLGSRQAAPRAAQWLRFAAAGVGVAAVAAGAALGWRWLQPRVAAPPGLNPDATPAPVWTNARLLIPDLNVDVQIRHVPLRNGQWDLSQLDEAAGLLAGLGQHPNDELAMALTGHVSLPPSVPGPFAELWTLPPVSKIIYRVGGTDYFYAITESNSIAPTDTEQLFVRDRSTLLLVTCTDWDYLRETYDGRLLVKAVLYDQQPSPAN